MQVLHGLVCCEGRQLACCQGPLALDGALNLRAGQTPWQGLGEKSVRRTAMHPGSIGGLGKGRYRNVLCLL
jgi:hypothetical protein